MNKNAGKMRRLIVAAAFLAVFAGAAVNSFTADTEPASSVSISAAPGSGGALPVTEDNWAWD